MKRKSLFVILWFCIVKVFSIEFGNTTGINDLEVNEESKVLSRRKRFLIFPDGSSFQLVFCTQNHGYLRLGNIVWFGNTAALAWELPTDPKYITIFKDEKKIYESHRRGDNKHILYLDEDGKVVGKVPYRRKPIVNPAFAKRSIDMKLEKYARNKVDIKQMHDMQREMNYLDKLEENSIEFHREGRKSLYGKLENLLNGLGWNGRNCILRILCETRRTKRHQGTFIDEIMRATFMLPKGREFRSEVHKEYDIAFRHEGSCAQLYPDCEDMNGIQMFQ